MAYGWIFMKPYDTKNKAMARLLGEGGNLVENTGHRFTRGRFPMSGISPHLSTALSGKEHLQTALHEYTCANLKLLWSEISENLRNEASILN